jgi:hypothetical protein
MNVILPAKAGLFHKQTPQMKANGRIIGTITLSTVTLYWASTLA